MSAQVIGKVKSPKGKVYTVKWDALSKDTYISYAGNTHIGRLPTSSAAMVQAEHWICSK